MTTKDDERTVKHGDLRARLFLRKGTSNWSAKIKQGGRWRPHTLGTPDLTEARTAALALLMEQKFRAEHGMAPRAKKFGAVVDAYLKQAKLAGLTRTIRDYELALRRHHVPFLGTHNIDRIEEGLLADFAEWRTKEVGRKLSKSTIQTHNAALNAVFDFAVKQGWMARHQVPDLENDGEEGRPRSAFTPSEFATLTDALSHWEKAGRDGLSRQIRFVLSRLIRFVAATGVRPGTETESITWRGVDDHIDAQDGRRYLKIFVTGKNGPRWIVAPDEVRGLLEDLRKWNPRATPDCRVFAVLDGRYCGQQYSERFVDLLASLGLKTALDGSARTLYSLRHFYATQMRRQGVPYETLKNQMGTSIAMLERHYDHVTALDEAAKLTGVRGADGRLTFRPHVATGAGDPLIVCADGAIRPASRVSPPQNVRDMRPQDGPRIAPT